MKNKNIFLIIFAITFFIFLFGNFLPWIPHSIQTLLGWILVLGIPNTIYTINKTKKNISFFQTLSVFFIELILIYSEIIFVVLVIPAVILKVSRMLIILLIFVDGIMLIIFFLKVGFTLTFFSGLKNNDFIYYATFLNLLIFCFFMSQILASKAHIWGIDSVGSVKISILQLRNKVYKIFSVYIEDEE